jgi:hypothetical protein
MVMTETITLVVQILLSSTTKPEPLTPKLLTPKLLTRVIAEATMEMLGTEAV